MKKYILLYTSEKQEDNICLKNMFKSNKEIKAGLTEGIIKSNISIIESLIKDGYDEFIFSSFEIGWDKIIKTIKDKHKKIIIKVICNTQDSLLFYDYEREKFFKMLECSKNKLIDEIAFLRKSQYQLYKSLNYKCTYLMQNYILESEEKQITKKGKTINLGFFPLTYTWDKNIFNQLCVGEMIDDCIINYNCMDEKMVDFLNIMNVKNNPIKMEKINASELIKQIKKNDVIISASFTEYMHPVFFISMELGIPCLCGNTSDLFDECEELRNLIITNSEDNPILNAKIIENILKNKDKIIDLYKKWKEIYNQKAKKNIEEFIG